MELKAKLEQLVLDNIKSEKHFLVEVVITASNGPKKVLILLDGDEGVNIDDCAELSRTIGHIIEEEELITDAYRLEVSSPGLDHPLKLLRQYKKNIGRNVKVTLHTGDVVKGNMIDATEEQVVVEEQIKKEKKEHILPMADIKKTEIQVSF